MNECKIVEDLLPLYAEDLVSEETKVFVEDHCGSCERCEKLRSRAALGTPAEPVDPKAYQKAMRRNQINLASRLVATFVLLFCVIYVVGTKLDAHMKWRDGRAPVEQIVESPVGDGKVTLVDWEASGYRIGGITNEGTLIYYRQVHTVVDEYGKTWDISEGGFAKPWENVQVHWAPDGAQCLMTADLLEGGTGLYILAYEHWSNEEGKSYSQIKLLPEGAGNGFVDVLTSHCKKIEGFPTGWEEVEFSFLEWNEGSETVVFVYRTDNGYRGVLDYNFVTDIITDVD